MNDAPSPHNREAERAVIGAVLRNNDVLHDIRAFLRAEHFYLDAHQKIWRAVCSIADQSLPVELVGLAEQLVRSGHYEDVGKASYIAELFQGVATSAHAVQHAKIVRERAACRDIIAAATTAIGDATRGIAESTEIITAVNQAFHDADIGVLDGENIRSANEVTIATLIDLDYRLTIGSKVGIDTGLPDVDDVLGGIEGGELVIVGARPGVGKTQYAINLCCQWSLNQGIPGYIASLEMSPEEYQKRLLAHQARVDSRIFRIRYGQRIDPEIQQRILDAAQRFHKTPLWYDQRLSLTTAQLVAQVRRQAKTNGIRYAIVDYIQLLRHDDQKIRRHEQVTEQSRALKLLAKELGIPLIVVSQLNRDGADERPRLQHLRDSGSLEQDADKVILLHKLDRERDPSQTMLEVIVAKNRAGQDEQVITIAFNRPTGRMECLAVE